MNASKFMDKQIMDLSGSNTTGLNSSTTTTTSSTNKDFLDLMNPQSEDNVDPGSSFANNNDDILPNYDFHRISWVPVGVSASLSSSDAPPASAAPATGPGVASRPWNSLESKPSSAALRSYSSLDPVEPEKVVMEKAQKLNDSAIVSEIDRTMKKYTDSLLHAIDGLSARLFQLESRTRQLEYCMDDLKVSLGNNHGSTDGKMRQLENALLEVQSGMQDIKDKQEVMEGHIKLAKLQIKVEKPSGTQNAAHTEPPPQLLVSAAPQHPQFQQLPVAASQPTPPLPSNAPSPPQQNVQPPPQQNIQPPPQQNIQPPPPVTTQYPPAQVPPVPQQDSYFPPPGQTQGAPSQQYQMPPPGQPQQQAPTPTPPASQPQQYPPAPSLPYPQPLPPTQQQHPPVGSANAPPQFQPLMSHHPEENPYVPAQSYPPNLRLPTSQPSSGVPHSQPYYGSPTPVYDTPSSGRSSAGFSSGYTPPSGPSEPHPYSALYGSGSSIKPQQPHSPGAAGGNYPKIPTARILPQAIPTTTGMNDGPSSGGSGNRVPVDDVVDKVTSMGFPREHVRATVRKLTENGHSVDLNVVLDKLMNDGDVQPQRGWFGR